jgi:hypothetical protein
MRRQFLLSRVPYPCTNSDGKTSDVLIREDIRQSLIFKDAKDIFLIYIRLFRERCLENYIRTNNAEDCANVILNGLNISASEISRRIDNFLETCGGDGESLRLYQQFTLDEAKLRLLRHYPTIVLNHEQVG